MGEYVIRIVSKWPFLKNVMKITPFFIGKSQGNIKRWCGSNFDSQNIIELKTRIATSFWFNVHQFVMKNESFIDVLREKSIHKAEKSVLAASLWDGISSGLLPPLLSVFEKWKMDTLVITILPSSFQSPHDHFNAISSLGLSLSEGSNPILLIDRECLENYVGVDRKGKILRENAAFHYLLDLIISKDSLIHELRELSEVFDVNYYTVLLAGGASLKIYGSLKNIFKSALFRPLLNFQISRSTIGYVFLRFPVNLEDSIPRERIEREFFEWIGEKANLRSLEVSDPVYVNDRNDRIDAVIFLGGFDKAEIFAPLIEKSANIAKNAFSRGFIKKDEWEKILENLTVSD